MSKSHIFHVSDFQKIWRSGESFNLPLTETEISPQYFVTCLKYKGMIVIVSENEEDIFEQLHRA